MQSFLVAWRLLLLISGLAFPQLIGILLYYRLKWAPRWVAVLVAALAPAVVFFWLTRIFISAELREIYADGPGCGMPVLAAVFFLFAGTAIQLVLGLFTQAVLSARRRRKVVY